MKYIRTKNGVYEYVEQRIYPSQYHKFGLYRHNLNSDYEPIISQSDTIEELCDGFFIDFISDLEEYKNFISEEKIFNRFGFDDFKEQFNAYRELEGDVYNHCEGYGLIKTSKGLIYVAKMNEEGVLELIWVD